MLNEASKRRAIGELSAETALWDGVIVHLTQEEHTAQPDDTLAVLDAIEADFGGYEPSAAVVWGETFDAPDGSAVRLGPLIQFLCDDSVTPQDIFGYYLENGDGELCGYESFPEPLPARNAFDAIQVIPRISFAQ
jgi:hypothetical protein